jgi:uncharacterized ferredoxin-like protein
MSMNSWRMMASAISQNRQIVQAVVLMGLFLSAKIAWGANCTACGACSNSTIDSHFTASLYEFF